MNGQKTGGRALGVPNRRTVELTDRLDELDCDPLQALIEIARDPATDTTLRARVYADLLPFIYPRRRAVEMSMEKPNLFDGVPLEDVLLIQEKLEALAQERGEAPSRSNRLIY